MNKKVLERIKVRVALSGSLVETRVFFLNEIILQKDRKGFMQQLIRKTFEKRIGRRGKATVKPILGATLLERLEKDHRASADFSAS